MPTGLSGCFGGQFSPSPPFTITNDDYFSYYYLSRWVSLDNITARNVFANKRRHFVEFYFLGEGGRAASSGSNISSLL